jgi:hypothetical protein
MHGGLERKRSAFIAGNRDGCAPVIVVMRALDDSANKKPE